MAIELNVTQDESSGLWLVRDGEVTIGRFQRLEDAIARARAVLLERDAGSMVVYTPSGRPREKFSLGTTDGQKIVQPA
jgi:hypothetical protein